MALGKIAQTYSVPLSGLAVRTTDARAQGFVPWIAMRRELGYLRRERKFRVFLYSGQDYTLGAIIPTDADGISQDLTTPASLTGGTSKSLIFTVTLEGPLEFLAFFDFISTGLDSTLTITGTRAPTISGAIANMFFPHNWEQGFNEFLRWKTDVLIAHDRTEQRIKLRSRPRREWSLSYFETGIPRRKLENYLAARLTRYYLVPVWYDARPIPTALTVGDDAVVIRTKEFDYHLDRPVALFDAWNNYEILTINTMADDQLTFVEPLTKDWPAGAMIAPLRYCRIIESKRVNRFTADAAAYEVTAETIGETLPELRIAPELYETYPVCPFPAGWRDNANDLISNKWVRLDNDTGVVQFDIQAEEPVFQRAAQFLINGRVDILEFHKFLAEQSGRLHPFWLTSDAREFSLALPVVADDTSITIHSIDYASTLDGSTARSYIELILKNGTVLRRQIVGVTSLPGDLEQLDVDTAFTAGFSESDLDQAAWNELVRFNSDDLELKWFTDEALEATIPVVSLP